jgi:hypothetical protein
MDHTRSNDGRLPSRPQSALGSTSTSAKDPIKTILRPESAARLQVTKKIQHDSGGNEKDRLIPKPRLQRSILLRPTSAQTAITATRPDSAPLASNLQANSAKAHIVRPSSALGRLQAPSLASAKQALHPSESLGRGFGAGIGIREESASALEKQNLVTRVKEILAQHSYCPSAAAADVRKVEAEEAPQSDSESDDVEELGPAGPRRARQVCELRPGEMARLRGRFPPAGLGRAEFERAMHELAGMALDASAQLFGKIDANDDGSIGWDAFLSYAVQAPAPPHTHALLRCPTPSVRARARARALCPRDCSRCARVRRTAASDHAPPSPHPARPGRPDPARPTRARPSGRLTPAGVERRRRARRGWRTACRGRRARSAPAGCRRPTSPTPRT